MNRSGKIINTKIHLPTSTSPNHTLVRTGGNRGHGRITGRRFSSAERNDSRKCVCVLKLEHMTRVQIYMKHNKQSPKRFKSAAFKLLATANTIPIPCSFEIRRRYSLNGNNNPRHASGINKVDRASAKSDRGVWND